MSLKNIVRDFAEQVYAQHRLAGEPEERLKLPVSELVQRLGERHGLHVSTTREFRIVEVGCPDIAVYVGDLVVGVIELKSVERSIEPKSFKDRERRQWERYQDLPNLIYTNGWQWRLYQGDAGLELKKTVSLGDELAHRGASALDERAIAQLDELLQIFLSFRPYVPKSPRELAAVLAPRCRLLRDAVLNALAVPGSKMVKLAKEWRRLLFDNADDARFADAYAQTVTYALLMARFEAGKEPVNIQSAPAKLARSHGLLARVLETLTIQRQEISGPLQILERTIAAVDTNVLLKKSENPWLYFYEDFLAAYDAKLRNEVGAYYTPVEVVHAQIELVHELLVTDLQKPLGFAEPDVFTLDPACGTGTYPYYIIASSLERIRAQQGEGAVAACATRLGHNLAAFEIMVGPYAVAHLRLTEALLNAGGRLSADGAQVFLSDTLETPNASGQLPLEGVLYERLVAEHERARKIKAEERVWVCIGNPPYDRQEIALEDIDKTYKRGGWVRYGERDVKPGIFEDFLPSKESRAGQHAKNLYNDYVYFWRWALWKVFEQSNDRGIVCFITASSYLRGPGFVAMRRHMRELLDELWIIDIGGDALGPRKTANVFSITTPVCIAIALRRGRPNRKKRARVWYYRLPDELDRSQKLGRLRGIRSFRDLDWERAPEGWEEPFVPGAAGGYAQWPRLDELCPWQHSGAQWKRTWPVAETKELLEKRWRALLAMDDRREAFHETETWTVEREGADLLDETVALPPICKLKRTAPVPRIMRYGWRALDRQWCLADGRLGDRLRPVLWQIEGAKQIFLTTLMSTALSRGPALIASAYVPDLHHFRGSYGDGGVTPLWRDSSATEPNITVGLLETLMREFKSSVKPEDFFAYVYGCLAHPAYTELLSDELAEPGPRVPITAKAALFWKAVQVGREAIRLHTFGERASGRSGGRISGKARCIVAIPEDDYPETFKYVSETLHVGAGAFAPVSKEVWEYEISGFKVVRSWLGFRMRKSRGRKSSSLDELRPERWTDEMTKELLELLWVLEHSLIVHQEQRTVFQEIIQGPLLLREALPRPTAGQEKAPRPRAGQIRLDFDQGERHRSKARPRSSNR